jgi:DTW domain-containing protein YfiP
MELTPLAAEPRAVCAQCRRPVVVCYCAHIVPVATRTKLVLVQHRRERDVPIGTLRMAELALPNASVFIGVNELDADQGLRAAISGPDTYLLYPGKDAIDVTELAASRAPSDGPITIVVVDGTWWQAQSLVRKTRMLQALPQVRFTPPRPSDYRIRKEPAEHCVSTIEAITHLLGALEGDAARFEVLLKPFEAMVDAQLRYVAERRGAPSRHSVSRKTRPRRVPVPELLRSRFDDVICVHAEANAWPANVPGGHDAELVHWCAVRPSSGERFEAILAPRQPLAPATPNHTHFDPARLIGGESLSDFLTRWRAFLRETDVLATWGHFAIGLAARDEVPLPATRVDVRRAATELAGERTGGQEAYLARLALPEPPALGEGRGGERVAQLVAIVRQMASTDVT